VWTGKQWTKAVDRSLLTQEWRRLDDTNSNFSFRGQSNDTHQVDNIAGRRGQTPVLETSLAIDAPSYASGYSAVNNDDHAISLSAWFNVLEDPPPNGGGYTFANLLPSGYSTARFDDIMHHYVFSEDYDTIYDDPNGYGSYADDAKKLLELAVESAHQEYHGLYNAAPFWYLVTEPCWAVMEQWYGNEPDAEAVNMQMEDLCRSTIEAIRDRDPIRPIAILNMYRLTKKVDLNQQYIAPGNTVDNYDYELNDRFFGCT